MIVTLTLNPSLDRTLAVPSLVRGEMTRALSSVLDPAGKGVNVARALLANGTDATAILPVGGGTGAQICALLESEHVPFDAIPVASESRSNVTMCEPDGTVTKVNEPGGRLTPRELSMLVESALGHSSAGEWVVVSGSVPSGFAPDDLADIVSRLRRGGRRVAVDTSGEPFIAALAAGPELVKPNRDELAEAVGRRIDTVADAVSACREIVELGAGAVLASLGAEGAVYYGASGVFVASAAAETVRNSVGAGDSLLAGFLASSGSDDERLGQAVRWAAAAVETRGSGVPVPEKIATKQPVISAVDGLATEAGSR